MPATVVRFNLVDPAASPGALGHRYRAALEMAAYADEHGVATVQTEEHHGSPDGWLPSPLTFAGAVLGATGRIAVTVSALTGPLYDPLRLAEDLAVLDHVGGGRLVTVAGIGYRPEEYAALGVDWHRRGALQDELLDTLLKAWTGEPFAFRGRTVRVTPRPHSSPHPLLIVGGSSRAAARRAARFGLPFFPSAHLPELEAYYREQLAEHGTQGWCLMPPPQVPLLHLSEDPDRAWAEYGRHLFHEAATYASWQSMRHPLSGALHGGLPGGTAPRGGLPRGHPRPVRRLRGGEHRPGRSPRAAPAVRGMPVEEGWRSLRLFARQVLPRLKD